MCSDNGGTNGFGSNGRGLSAKYDLQVRRNLDITERSIFGHDFPTIIVYHIKTVKHSPENLQITSPVKIFSYVHILLFSGSWKFSHSFVKRIKMTIWKGKIYFRYFNQRFDAHIHSSCSGGYKKKKNRLYFVNKYLIYSLHTSFRENHNMRFSVQHRTIFNHIYALVSFINSMTRK